MCNQQCLFAHSLLRNICLNPKFHEGKVMYWHGLTVYITQLDGTEYNLDKQKKRHAKQKIGLGKI